MKRPQLFVAVCAAACICVVSCSMFTHPLDSDGNSLSGGGSGDDPSQTDGSPGTASAVPSASSAGCLSATYDYVAASDAIVVFTNQNYCYGDSLVSNVDVSVEYDLAGDTLWLEGVSATGPLQEELLLDGDDALLLVRDGHGAGLEGSWVLVAAGDRYGTMHAPSKSLGTQVVEFETTKLHVRVSKPRTEIEYAVAVALVDLDPNISVNVVSDYEVRARGHRTNETITLRRFDWDSLAYTSSDSDHDKHTFRANPTACPNEPAPQWFYDFVKDNSGLVKR